MEPPEWSLQADFTTKHGPSWVPCQIEKRIKQQEDWGFYTLTNERDHHRLATDCIPCL